MVKQLQRGEILLPGMASGAARRNLVVLFLYLFGGLLAAGLVVALL